MAKVSGSTAPSTMAGTAPERRSSKEVAGVKLGREGEHADVDLVAEEQFERPVRRLLPGFVAIEDQNSSDRSSDGAP